MEAVRIVEVGPRDGLQNVSRSIPVAVKLGLIKKLQHAGLRSIEITSVVSPKAVPQLSDCLQIMSSPLVQGLLQKRDHLRLPVLVPNTKGLKVAIEHGIQEVAVFISATEGFSRANINCSVADAIHRARTVSAQAKAHGLAVRGYVSCIFADPYSGSTPPEAVYDAVKALVEMGCYEVSLGDTTGVGTPAEVHRLLDFLLSRGIDVSTIAGHFHDTYGQAVANIWEAYKHGVRTFDSSVGGLGGCPFAPGAKGNVATEDVVYLFQQAGIETGVNLNKLAEIGTWISKCLEKSNDSRAGAALIAKAIQPTLKKPRQKMEWSLLQKTDHILVYRCGANGKLVLNQPRKGNALSLPLVADLGQAFRDFETDDSINRIVITGEGKFFCTGMDLGEGEGPFGGDSEAKFRALLDLFELIDQSPKVTIACINGPAFGGGIGLAFSCDIRVSLSSAAFTLSETKLGLCPAIISKYVIREWGVARTRDAILTARPVPASELCGNGVISIVADSSELQNELESLLQLMRRSAPGASTMSKKLIGAGWVSPGTPEQQQVIAELFGKMMQPDSESVFGVAEFLKQRVVDWDKRAGAPKAKL